METAKSNDKKFTPLIIGISLVLPLVVAVLYFLPEMENVSPELRTWLNKLPLLNASLNGTASIMLVAGFFAIKNGKITLHRRFMSTAILLSVVFLLSYVAYHLTTASTSYGGEGLMRNLYFFILISHIILSAAIVPLVLITYVRALSQRFDKHRKIARITLPLWLYVTVTGVIVYLMISPYYPFNM